VSPELDALAAYLQSLDQVPPSPFRNPDGSFTAEARRGRAVFGRAGCQMCHAAPYFTNSETDELFDVGTLLPSSGQRLGSELSGLDTPSLKGLWQSAPYLHDGRAPTLRDVLRITGDQMGTVSNLSETELNELVRYLLELDDVPETAAHDEEAAAEPSCRLAGPGSSRATLLVCLLLAAALLRTRLSARQCRRESCRS
jgi:cytochrome c peroxidase